MVARRQLLLLLSLLSGRIAVGQQQAADGAENTVRGGAGVLNGGLECHHQCWPSAFLNNGSGHCATNFCGEEGACCRRGMVQFPCNGQVGCLQHQCCVRIPKQPPSPPPPPAPRPPPPVPLSECAISRVSYAVVEGRHDEAGDKLFKVVVGVEPWRAGMYVILTYRQRGVEEGREMPIHPEESDGAILAAARQEADLREPGVEYRLLQWELGDGLPLQPCQSADVRTGVAGDLVAQAAHASEAAAQDEAAWARASGDAPPADSGGGGEPGALRTRRLGAAAAGASAGPERRELESEAGVCHRGEFWFWSYGDVRKDLVRIGCHLAYSPPLSAPRRALPPPPPPPPPQATPPVASLPVRTWGSPGNGPAAVTVPDAIPYAQFVAGKAAPPPAPTPPAQRMSAGRVTLVILLVVGALVGASAAAQRLAGGGDLVEGDDDDEEDEDEDEDEVQEPEDAEEEAAEEGRGGAARSRANGCGHGKARGKAHYGRLAAAEGSAVGLLGGRGDEDDDASAFGSETGEEPSSMRPPRGRQGGKMPSLSVLD